MRNRTFQFHFAFSISHFALQTPPPRSPGAWPVSTPVATASPACGRARQEAPESAIVETALAPGRPHRSPPLPAQRTDDSGGVALTQEGVTQQALRWKKQLLDRGAKHGARAVR